MHRRVVVVAAAATQITLRADTRVIVLINRTIPDRVVVAAVAAAATMVVGTMVHVVAVDIEEATNEADISHEITMAPAEALVVVAEVAVFKAEANWWCKRTRYSFKICPKT